MVDSLRGGSFPNCQRTLATPVESSETLAGALEGLVRPLESLAASFDTAVEVLVIDAGPLDTLVETYDTAAGPLEALLRPSVGPAAPFDTSVEVLVIKAGALVVVAGALEIENASEIENPLEIEKSLEIGNALEIQLTHIPSIIPRRLR